MLAKPVEFERVLFLLVAITLLLLSANFLWRPLHEDIGGSVGRSMIAALSNGDVFYREHRPFSYSALIRTLIYPFQTLSPNASPLEVAFFLRIPLLILCAIAAFSASFLIGKKNSQLRLLFSAYTFSALIGSSYWIIGQAEFLAVIFCLISTPFVLNRG